MNANNDLICEKVHSIAALAENLWVAEPSAVTDVQLDLILAHRLWVDVKLDGFRWHVEGRCGPHLPRLADVLDKIGAPETAAAVRRIIGALPEECRNPDEGTRMKAVASLDADRQRMIDEMQAHVEQRADHLMLLLWEFVRRHETELPGTDEASRRAINDRVLVIERARDERIQSLNTMWSGKHRPCPRCGTRFRSVQNWGACPNCRHQFYASHPTNQADWPRGPETRPE